MAPCSVASTLPSLRSALRAKGHYAALTRPVRGSIEILRAMGQRPGSEQRPERYETAWPHGPRHPATFGPVLGRRFQPVLVQVAWCATRKKDSYYRAQFYQIRGRRGAKKAIMAVAASILTAIYHMLANEQDHVDLGKSFLERRDSEKAAKRLCKRLQDLGYEVEVKKAS